MIFTRAVDVRDFKKKGVVSGLEVDFDIPYPDGLPAWRIRKKSPFVPGKKLGRQRAILQSKQWGEALRVKLWNDGIRPKGRQALRQEEAARLAALPPPVPTLRQFAPRWLSAAIESDHTVEGTKVIRRRHLEFHLLPILGDRPLDQIGLEDYQRCKGVLKTQANGKPRGGKNVNAILAQLVRILRDAYEWKVIPNSPHKMTYVPQIEPEIRPYTEAQYQLVVSTARTSGWPILLAVLLAGDAGLRMAEVLGLRWEDVDLVAGCLTVRQQEPSPGVTRAPKGKKIRRVPLSPVVKSALELHRHLGPRVVCGTDGARVDRKVVARWLEAVEELADVETKTIHQLRHTFACRCDQRGATMVELKELLGHSSLLTTQRYLHAFPSSVERVIARLGDKEEKV